MARVKKVFKCPVCEREFPNFKSFILSVDEDGQVHFLMKYPCGHTEETICGHIKEGL
ncbi:MAG: hypothetical protein ACTSPL_04185 [Candidatus Odinarchaeia archaeon]